MKDFWGGTQDFEYDHPKYWPALVTLCETRKAKWLENWKILGGTVGIHESAYKQDQVLEGATEEDVESNA